MRGPEAVKPSGVRRAVPPGPPRRRRAVGSHPMRMDRLETPRAEPTYDAGGASLGDRSALRVGRRRAWELGGAAPVHRKACIRHSARVVGRTVRPRCHGTRIRPPRSIRAAPVRSRVARLGTRPQGRRSSFPGRSRRIAAMPRREGAGERSRRFRPCPRAGRVRSLFEAAGGTRTDGQSREVDRGTSRISAFLMLRRPGRRRHRRAGHPRAACRGARPQDVAPRAACSRHPRPPASRPTASRSPRPSASCRAPTPRPAPAPFPFGALGVSQRVRVHVISHVTSGGDVDRLPVPGVVAARAQRVVDEATPGLALADPGVEVPEADRGLDTGGPAREVVSS